MLRKRHAFYFVLVAALIVAMVRAFTGKRTERGSTAV